MQASPAPTARAHAPGETCVLCGGARRTYLFVVGRSRMTRCDECQLVSRTDEGRLSGEAESYALDTDSERAIRSAWSRVGRAGRQRATQRSSASSTAAASRRASRATSASTSR